MKKKLKIILALISLSVCVGLTSGTYSRYVASTTGNIDVMFANWQILINNEDITSSSVSEISFVPIIEENVNVASNTIAPSSYGYFDIEIDPSNVDVSFNYNIDLAIENEFMPDLMITKYAFIGNDYEEGTPLEYITLTAGNISNTMVLNELGFEKFTIRVFFEWYEGIDELMNDLNDTQVGSTATEDTKLKMRANISFEQLI